MLSSMSRHNHNGPYQILVVDDMATNRGLVKLVLAEPEFEVFEAGDGEEALEFLTEQSVDAVLLDVVMPNVDGFDVCARIRNDLSLDLLPIIMLTSLGSPDDVAQGMEVGADDYVAKPFNNVELLARVRAAVDRKRLTDRLDDMESALFALARMVEARDDNTGAHCDRLAHMGVLFGETLGLSYDEQEALRRGGILHDIGKLGIPDSVLLKKGKLNADEWEVMKQHTTIGASLCSPLRTMRKTVDIVACHHEKWDGSGYPKGLKGSEIPLLARVFQIVDIFDALSAERPYKAAFPREKVVAIMREETDKGFWDPELMAVFLNMLNTRADELVLPASMEPDKSTLIMEQISKTGVLDWDI